MIRSLSWRNRKAAQAYLEAHSDMTSPILGNLNASAWNRDRFSRRRGECYVDERDRQVVGFLAFFADGNTMLHTERPEYMDDFIDVLDEHASYHTLWVFGASKGDVKVLTARLSDSFRLERYEMLVQEEAVDVFTVTLDIQDVKDRYWDPKIAYFCQRVQKECFGYDAYMPSVMARMADRGRDEPYLIGSLPEGEKVAQTHLQALCRDYGYIGGVATLPEYRGKGYARELLLTMCRFVRRIGRTPSLTVDPENTPAYTLYRDCGFVSHGDVIVAERKNY